MARILKPPTPLESLHGPVVFLAGSIEMGTADDWQAEFTEMLGADDNVTLLNPRRDDWDSSWEQAATNPRFREQVEWELAGLDRANVVVMYLDPQTRSPVSLLEMGLHARRDGLVVCCPDGFWRKGNVDVVCQRYGVPMVGSLTELVEHVRPKLRGQARHELTVRRALERDVAVLTTFTLEEAKAAEGRDLDDEVVSSAILAAVRNPRSKATYYVADRDGEPVGHCSTFREWSDWRDAAYTWVQSMYVAPAARKTGVMQAMLDRVTEDARAAGSPELRIYVHVGNDRALAAWKREGFTGGDYWMASRKVS